MNNDDRGKLKRVYDAMRIPGFGSRGSSMSTSIVGGLKYAHDAEFVLSKVRELLYAIGAGGNYDGEYDDLIVELEQWQQKRKKESWE